MKRKQFIIAIDGPAGAGKSTTARLVAKRLGFIYVDTGALYRALTLKALRKGIAPHDGTAIEQLAAITKFDLRLDGGQQQVLLDGENVTSEIRTPEVTNNIGPISAMPRVRELLVQRQRKIAEESAAPGVVMEGRDIGTVVFPHADLKIFMLASIDVRTQRRQQDLLQQGVSCEFVALREEILLRDQQDTNRAAGALRRAEDAVELDTTKMNIEEQVEFIVEHARRVISAL
jgi:cytidylate kinase